MGRKQIREIRNDKELEQDDKNRDHERKQKNLDAIANISRVAIYITPILLLVWAFLMAFHHIKTSNWNAFENAGKTVLLIVVGYIAHYLQTIGIKK